MEIVAKLKPFTVALLDALRGVLVEFRLTEGKRALILAWEKRYMRARGSLK